MSTTTNPAGAEWAPSHDRAGHAAQDAVQVALDLRDNGGERPGDD